LHRKIFCYCGRDIESCGRFLDNLLVELMARKPPSRAEGKILEAYSNSVTALLERAKPFLAAHGRTAPSDLNRLGCRHDLLMFYNRFQTQLAAVGRHIHHQRLGCGTISPNTDVQMSAAGAGAVVDAALAATSQGLYFG